MKSTIRVTRKEGWMVWGLSDLVKTQTGEERWVSVGCDLIVCGVKVLFTGTIPDLQT